MNPLENMAEQACVPAFAPAFASMTGLRVGVDIAQISAIASSLAIFGDRFTQRIFSAAEIAYATEAPVLTAQRLAARFAAKEAAMKAFDLSEAGVCWRDIEVTRSPSGACGLLLHGRATEHAERSGCTQITVSLSHDGDYAAAMVAALAPRH